MKIQGIIAGLASLALMTLALPAHALPNSEVIFDVGSNCGGFEGDLTSGRLFNIQLEPNQELMVKTDGHVQTVQDDKGNKLEDMGGYDYRYVTTNGGAYAIKMVGRSDSKIEFCTDKARTKSI